MFGEHHHLTQEFPELKDKIHELKTHNPAFAELFDKYNAIDNEIYRIEEQIETPSDEYTENLKKQRLQLKDQLFQMLNQA
ncbi:MAG: DUF465 domain-containing protein [Gammaproteobacteria bacterium]|nr:DUF465 domain-containing protein [Gammaproteobacteria bacterium]